MKKYIKLDMEITLCKDVIATSAEITTGGVKFPWSTSDALPSSYQLMRFTDQGSPNDDFFET